MVNGVVTEPGQGGAIGSNGPDLTAPGQTRSYAYDIPDAPAMEGAHFLHSPADARYQIRHGLFGALVVEPAGSTFDNATGPTAAVTLPDGTEAVEHVLLYASNTCQVNDDSCNTGERKTARTGVRNPVNPVGQQRLAHRRARRARGLPLRHPAHPVPGSRGLGALARVVA